MTPKLKKLAEQVMVITFGASVGIGLVTARMAAKQAPAWCWLRAAKTPCASFAKK